MQSANLDPSTPLARKIAWCCVVALFPVSPAAAGELQPASPPISVSALAVKGQAASLRMSASETAGDDESSAEQAQPAVRITMGRAVDLVGPPAYARRTSFGGTDLEVEFSATPVLNFSGVKGAAPSGLPLASSRLSSRFGWRTNPVTGRYAPHSGVDLAAAAGTPIHATAAGVVSQAAWRGGYGLMVTLQHGGGVETRYAHMSRVAVSAGQTIRAGDVLGYVGSTGRSTGAHLHYETRVNGRAVDPLH